MARTRAVPRRRPNINFQQRGNFDLQRVAATRNISSSESSARSSAASSPVSPASPARSPLASLPARSPQAKGPQARNPPLKRRIRANDVKIKFVLPKVKDVEVKHNRRVVRKIKVRRIAKYVAKKRNVRYG